MTNDYDNIQNNWATPDWLYDELNKKYKFTFDPCPINGHLKMDGLKCEWGKRNFVNPPYQFGLKKKFILKALEERKKGRKSVFLIPVSTGKLYHEHIVPNAKKIEFLNGRLAFQQYDCYGEPLGNGKDKAKFDSMIVEF